MKKNLSILLLGLIIGGLIAFWISSRNKAREELEIRHNMVIEKIEALGNLEVVRYNIQDVMEYKKIRQFLPNAKAILVAVGEVIVCVDLTTITEEDIYTSKDSIRISLANPEICHVKIDHSKSRIFDTEYGLWETAQITDEAYRYAEKELNGQALKLDVAGKGRDNTVNLLTPILKAMGFEKVLITFKPKTAIDTKR